MAKYLYFTVDVTVDEEHYLCDKEGELWSCDDSRVHFYSREDAETAAQKCRERHHPYYKITVNS